MIVGTGSLDWIGKSCISLVVLVGLIRASSMGSPGPAEAGDSVIGNLKPDVTSGPLRGDARAAPPPGVTGAVAVPERRPPMDLSGGYEAWNNGDDWDVGSFDGWVATPNRVSNLREPLSLSLALGDTDRSADRQAAGRGA